MRLTTITDTKAGLIATNGKLYFAKRHDRPAPWQVFTTQDRAQSWLDSLNRSAPSIIRWS